MFALRKRRISSGFRKIKGIKKMSLDLILRDDERAIFSLRALYEKYGYTQYKMSKFEEYDLYALNKQFLVSDNIITFTDTDGKLMALKPDVTLSIIKNGKDNTSGVQKVFYNENVYRVSKGTKTFKEIMQAGLECFGEVDDYLITEVIMLAIKSLESISNEYVLDISSLDVVNAIFEKLNLSQSAKKKIINALSQKNANAIDLLVKEEKVSDSDRELLKALCLTYGKAESVKAKLKKFDLDQNTLKALDNLISTIDSLNELGLGANINVDFSVVSDLNYYNGLVFKGFISGIPTSILSGGEYDNLMQKMGKKSRAIGFAIYLDELSKLSKVQIDKSVDVAIEYGDTDKNAVLKKVNELIASGKTVLADKKIADNVKYKEIIKL